MKIAMTMENRDWASFLDNAVNYLQNVKTVEVTCSGLSKTKNEFPSVPETYRKYLLQWSWE